KSPVLTGVRKGIRRRADRRVKTEVLLPRPHVGAVSAHHEREVAEDARVHIVSCLLPLLCREPLQVGVIEDLGLELAPRRLQRGRRVIAQRRLPRAPVASAALRVQRAEQRVLVQPPPLTSCKEPQLPRPRSVFLPFLVQEISKAGAQRAILEAADRAVLNPL